MTAQMPPGWYDDPDGSPNEERRWDGHAWTPERRRKTAGAKPTPVAPSPYPQAMQSPPSHPLEWPATPDENPVPGWWRRQTTLAKALVALAAGILTVLMLFGLVRCSETVRYRNACEQEADAYGFRGDQKAQVVDLCVQ